MRHLRALAAAAALLLLLAGLPALLAVTIGNPLAAWPDLRAGDFSDTVVVDVLAGVAWLAWAQLTLATGVETVAAATRIRLPARIPGVFAGQQRLARSLVAAAFLLSPAAVPVPAGHTVVARPAATAAALAVAPVAETQPHATHQNASADATASARAAAKTYVVSSDGPGTYWDLADTFLGSGQRWKEIWHLNQGRHQADGAVMSTPGLLRPGWTVLLPQAAALPAAGQHSGGAAEVAVHRGDTLSRIADDHGVADWHRLWQANAGRLEPGGRHFNDPDMILPGWTIDVPEGQAGPAPVARSAPAPAAPSTSRPTATTPEPTAQPPTSPAGAKATASPSTAAPGPARAGGPTTSTEAHPDQDTSGSQPGILAAAAFGGGGLLLAGVSLAALARHRRRQARYRRPGRSIAATPAPLAGMERALLTGTGAADVAWLAQALAGLTHLIAATPDGRLPDVVAARLAGDQLELVLTSPDPDAPRPWTADGTGQRWRLDRDAGTGFDPGLADRHVAPYPALTAVGWTEAGDYWLLDLERVGALGLTGDRQRCLDLARYMAAELAHNTWSEQLQVSLAGFGTELAELNPDRLDVATDPAAAVAALAARLRATGGVIEAAGVDVLTGRLRDVAADAWFPHVLLLAGDEPVPGLPELLDQLRGRRGRAAVGLLLAGESATGGGEARWQLHVDAAGRLAVPQLELDVLAQQLPASEAAQLAQLLAMAARTADRPVPDADAGGGAAGWQAYADATGALRTALTPPPAPAAAALAGEGQQGPHRSDPHGPGAVRPDSLLPLPAQTYLETAATTEQDVATLAPQVPDDVRRQVEDADPGLDADLAAWADPACPRPKLSLLGPLQVSTAGGDLPADRPRRGWHTEIVAYLAVHSRGVSAEQLGADLWPDDPDIATKSKLRQAIYLVRRWLGADPDTGESYLPNAINPQGGPGLYRLDGVLVDADLFRRLRLRAVARGGDGIPDLAAALDLVAGPPFTDRRPGGYGWLADDPLDHAYTGMIVDVAHVVATHHLGAGHPEQAAEAARVALRAGSSDDIALLDLLAAYDAQGNRAEAGALVQRILANHDAEVEEDLPPRTADVLHRRRWLPQAG